MELSKGYWFDQEVWKFDDGGTPKFDSPLARVPVGMMQPIGTLQRDRSRTASRRQRVKTMELSKGFWFDQEV